MLRSPSIARLANRALLSVSGSQAAEFLNGILASAVRNSPKRPTFSAILHAQGRVLCDIFLYTNTDEAGQQGFLIEYDPRPSDAPALLPMLKKYVLRSKVKIRDVTEQYDVWASWGSPLDCPLDNLAREWQWAPSGTVEPIWNNTDGQWPWGSEDRTLFDRRAIGLGSRFLMNNGDKPHRATTHDIKTPDDYTLHRILLGVPEGSIDIPPTHAFPMESNLDIMGGLDFRKGCYVGQELTVRTYHTGMVRKRILPVVIHDTQTTSPENMVPNASSPLYHSGLEIRPVVLQREESSRSSPRPRGSGKLLTSVQGVGLALLRLEQVEAVMQGSFQLQIDANGKTMAVNPRWPSWWPRQPVGSE